MEESELIPSSWLKAVDLVVQRRLAGMNLVDLQECQEQLKATREALLDMQQNYEVWRKLAEMRGDEIARLQSQVQQLNEEQVATNTRMALLESALANYQANGE